MDIIGIMLQNENYISLFTSLLAIAAFIWGIIKLVVTPVVFNVVIRKLNSAGIAEISKGDIQQGRDTLQSAINYKKSLFTQKYRIVARINYAESFQHGDSASLESLEKADAEYSKVDDFFAQKGKRYRLRFRFYRSTYLLMCANRVDLLNKTYKYTQNELLLLRALSYGETAISGIKNAQLLALAKSTTAITCRILAGKVSDINLLLKSIKYSEDALLYYESSGNIVEMIRMNNNLGNAYSMFCIKFRDCSDDFRLNYTKAYEHFHAAINSCPYTLYPESYARNYMNLGTFIYRNAISTPNVDIASFHEAETAIKKALEVYEIARYPFEYASCKMNLMLIISYQGILSKDVDLVNESIKCGDNALEVFTATKYPAYNLRVHKCLGTIYDKLASIILNKKRSAKNDKTFISCCEKAIDNFEFIALEQSDPIATLQTITKLMTLASDILLVSSISHECRLKYQSSLNKYHNKLREISKSCPKAFEEFKKMSRPIPDDAKIIARFPQE